MDLVDLEPPKALRNGGWTGTRESGWKNSHFCPPLSEKRSRGLKSGNRTIPQARGAFLQNSFLERAVQWGIPILGGISSLWMWGSGVASAALGILGFSDHRGLFQPKQLLDSIILGLPGGFISGSNPWSIKTFGKKTGKSRGRPGFHSHMESSG